MAKYLISVDGCDDSTEIEVDLTPTQFKLLERIAEQVSEKANYGCMPSMSIEKVEKKK